MLLSRLLRVVPDAFPTRDRPSRESIKLAWILFCGEVIGRESVVAETGIAFVTLLHHAFARRQRKPIDGQAMNSLIGHDRVRHKAIVARGELFFKLPSIFPISTNA